MPMSDQEILDVEGMIAPIFNSKIPQFGTSYGLSSHGYDVRLGHKISIMRKPNIIEKILRRKIDLTKPFPKNLFITRDLRVGESFTIYPKDFVLCSILEWIKLPENITNSVKDKSTLARIGLALQNTVGEAGWEGRYILEITNHGSWPIELYCGMGIAQVWFEKCTSAETPYYGKYQGQDGMTLAIPSK